MSVAASRPNDEASPRPAAVPPKSAIERLLYAYALFLLCLIVAHVMFTDRRTWGDEDGLYNPIYMYQHYGKVTYPMQLQYDYMTIHPPVHYFVVGLLARLGLQVFYAAALPLILLSGLAFSAILMSRLSLAAKLSLLTGFTLATLVYIPLATIRPDMHVTFAWFCGLMFLESARSMDWAANRLFAGGFFVAYSSGLHYWAGAAALILSIYWLNLLLQRHVSRRLHRLAAMTAGALLFYVPYCSFFIIPDFYNILRMLRGADATGGGVRAAISIQLTELRGLAPESWPLELPIIGKLVMLPVKRLFLPPLLLAEPLLFLDRSLRWLAFTGAILPLFVLAMVSRKMGLFYMAPELSLYAIGFCLLGFSVFGWMLRTLKIRRRPLCYGAALVLSSAILARSAPIVKSGLTLKLIDWDIARAANRRIVGNNALVAINQCYDWYTVGATRLYWFVQPLKWDAMERSERERRFDSIALLSDWFANRSTAIPFPQFYLQGHLNLRGFYFPGRWDQQPTDPLLPLLHLSARNDLPKQGFGFDRRRRVFNHYTESADGGWVFVSFLAFLHYPEEWPRDITYMQMFFVEKPQGTEPQLFALVTTWDNWMRQRAQYAAKIVFRDEVRLKMEEIPAADFLQNNNVDQPIEFMDDGGGGRD